MRRILMGTLLTEQSLGRLWMWEDNIKMDITK
jgi:hypothetical protein